MLGAHVPTAGGLAQGPGARAGHPGATAIQVFTRNQRQWAAKPLAQRGDGGLPEALAASGVRAVMAHASYLINLASPVPAVGAGARRSARRWRAATRWASPSRVPPRRAPGRRRGRRRARGRAEPRPRARRRAGRAT